MGDRDAVCRFSAGKGGNQQRAADGDERQGDQTRRIVAEEGIDLNANQRREGSCKMRPWWCKSRYWRPAPSLTQSAPGKSRR